MCLKHVDSHRAYLAGLKQEGLLIASGPMVPRNWRHIACCEFPMTKRRRRSTVSATTIRTRGSDSRNMNCGPGPRRLVPRTWTACKRTCHPPPPFRMERMSPRVRPRLSIAAARNLCSLRRWHSAAGIVAGNFAWRAPQVWLLAFVLAAVGSLRVASARTDTGSSLGAVDAGSARSVLPPALRRGANHTSES